MSSNSRTYIARLLWMTALLAFAASMCAAQTAVYMDAGPAAPGTIPATTANFGGLVVDQDDAALSGATVTIRGADLNLQKTAVTDVAGQFLMTDVHPGRYTLAVNHDGFSTAEIRNVQLAGGSQTSLRIQLVIGEINETVSITPDSATMRASASTALTLDRDEIEALPLNGRSLQALTLLAPGAVATRATFAEQGQLSINGQRADTNYFILDGVSANIGVAAGASGTGQSGTGSLPGLSVMGSTNTLVSVDAVQEFKLLTNVFAPEYGRTPGAQVVFTTRSGSNQFHGSAFDYFRGDILSARDWLARPLGDVGNTIINNFGGVVGGPILKDRTFFFLSYEGMRAKIPQFAMRDVPSMNARQNARVQLRPVLNAFPVPNGPNRSNQALAEFTASYSDSADFNSGSLRLDQTVGERLTLFGRVSYAPSGLDQRGAGSSLNDTLRLSFDTMTATAGATYLITPRLVNDFRLNYSHSSGNKVFDLDDFGGATPLVDAAIFPASASRGDSFYGFSLGGSTTIFTGKDANSVQDQLNIVDNISFILGSHQLKFGIDYRRLTSVYDQWKYRENAMMNPSLVALESGVASLVSVSTQARTSVYFTNLSAYAQDTWRVSDRLSLTYGIRWDYNPAPMGGTDQSLYTVKGLDDPANLQLAEVGTPLYRSTYNNFAPRLGVAYQLSNRPGRETLLRGGFGVFYDLGTGPLGNSASSFPYQRRVDYSDVQYPLGQTYGGGGPYGPYQTISQIRVAVPDLKLPRVLQWNAGIEQSIGSRQTITASYVGAAGRRLLRTELLQNPTPYFGQVFVTTNKATADYNALQVQYQRRLSRGFQAIASYTWSHSIDIASNDSTATLPSLAGYDASLDRGPSDFDVRHIFSAAVSYDIPALIGSGIGNALVRNWSLETIAGARTAAPLDIFSKRNSQFGSFNLRPNLREGTALYLKDPAVPGGRRLNPDAFMIPTGLSQGTLGRNALRGFPFAQFDVALSRRFVLTDRFSLQCRIEAFNILNHPNYGDPVSDLGSNQFGRSVALLGRSLTATNNTGFNPLFQAGGPRTISIGLKLQF